MSDFSARITAGSTLVVWTDPTVAQSTSTGVGGYPSRLNPIAAYPHKCRRVELGATVTAKATVGGVEGPVDAALGGRLFTAYWAEVPLWPGPAISLAGGQSSVATFTPPGIGHYLFVFRRDGGGALALPFKVELTS